MTRDERFLIGLYEFLLDSEGAIPPMHIAKPLGYNEKLTKNILRGLCQANLVKMSGPDAISLTSRGREVARSLLNH